MNFLHTQFWGGVKTTVVVTIDSQCNVMLLNDMEFTAYKSGRPFRYYGGWTTLSTIRIVPPGYGHWHVVVDLGGRGGSVRVSIHVIEQPRKTAV